MNRCNKYELMKKDLYVVLGIIISGKAMAFMLLNFVVQRQVKLLITELALLILSVKFKQTELIQTKQRV